MGHPRRFPSAREAEAYLLSFVNYELFTSYRPTARTHDLDRFADRLRAAGWRPDAVPAIHVGGTNGKGTVSHLLAALLEASGVRTGLYTSPHLQSMRERVRIGGRPIPASVFRDVVSRIAAAFPDAERGFRTTFEHLTALAFLVFQDAGVECAVIEVGLGGRLDATNVLPPGPVVWTPIALDHTHILGRTVAAIARDKAQIAKRGGAAWTMPQTPAAMRALRRRCVEQGVPLVETSRRVHVETVSVRPDGALLAIRGREDYGEVPVRLLGVHQADNVAAAVAVVESLLGERFGPPHLRAALRGIVVPGRLERFRRRGRVWIVDGGHNPAAARAVAAALLRHAPGARIHAVVGMAADKEHVDYLRGLAPAVERVVATRSDNPRAATPARLVEAAREAGLSARSAAGLATALRLAEAGDPDAILIAGSFVLAGEARALLKA